MKQINFTGNLPQDENANTSMFFIFLEEKEAILDFESILRVILFCFNVIPIYNESI